MVGQFLQCLFEYSAEQAPTSFVSCTDHSLGLSAVGPPPLLVTPFILHSLLDFTRKDVVRLIFQIFQDPLPASYQLLHCSRKTRQEDLELFFTRIDQWKNHRYLIVGVNLLPNELQEVKKAGWGWLCTDDDNIPTVFSCAGPGWKVLSVEPNQACF